MLVFSSVDNQKVHEEPEIGRSPVLCGTSSQWLPSFWIVVMNYWNSIVVGLGLLPCLSLTMMQSAQASSLSVVYPPSEHETIADRIFFIGTAAGTGTVFLNGEPIARTQSGHFAPSIPLKLGHNPITVRYGSETLKFSITRLSTVPDLPSGAAFAKDSLLPTTDIARLPDELLCFGAIAPANATVSVKLADQVIPLQGQPLQVDLPANNAVLIDQTQPQVNQVAGRFQGCAKTVLLGDLGKPEYQLVLADRRLNQSAAGAIRVLAPAQLDVAEVTADQATARTGPSTDYSRLTPLPKGTQATITGYENNWVRLDYGGWVSRKDIQVKSTSVPPNSLIRSVKAKRVGEWTEITFPLQVPVPVRVQEGDRSFTLTLYNTTAQTDTILMSDDPLITRLDWQQAAPGQVQYTFVLKSPQAWGYRLRYEGSSLILALKHPPNVSPHPRKQTSRPLEGIKILLDPGHGGPEDLGARGPTGYAEKTIALRISQLVRDRLAQKGARVFMTRDQDADVPLENRVALINQVQPALALSLHYNALPDAGDAIKTQGIGAFWYHPQAHGLAMYLHNYLVKTLKRPSYGVFWNNLALTRPTIAPSVLMELGFMINPDEFDWITNPQAQQKLAGAIADGITQWLQLQAKQS